MKDNNTDNIDFHTKRTSELLSSVTEKDKRIRVLEIASKCSIPGEPSSRTIERAIEFKKYIDEN